MLKSQDGRVAISAITEAELLYGLARKPEATTLAQYVHLFLQKIRILPWDSACAQSYATLRSELQKLGLNLSTNDMLIAAHAHAKAECLVTNDKALEMLSKYGLLAVKNWSKDAGSVLGIEIPRRGFGSGTGLPPRLTH
jgi:tRNA(fMet)-specific endonuclease VapC